LISAPRFTRILATDRLSMSLKVLGINHKTAPVAVREQVAFDHSKLAAALSRLTQETGAAEALILSTCNRTEVYWQGTPSADSMSRWLAQHHAMGSELLSCLYDLEEQHAVEHLFMVASGLDSMVVGEAQILGQLKEAYRTAQEAGVTGPALNKLFQSAFATAKRVRTETRIGANAVSIASAAVSLAKRVFADLSAHSALLIGAGEMIALTARHLASQGVKRMVIANRSLGRAQELALEFNAYAVALTDLETRLVDADIVISCTASPVPLITVEAAKAAVRTRRHKPIFMVDLAVPRDIEPEVSALEDVYHFSIDDLQHVIEQNMEKRHAEAADARLLVAEEVAQFLAESRAHDAGPAIRTLRTQAEAARAQTLEHARKILASGRGVDEALEYLANTLTNRLMHSPTQALREAAVLGDVELAKTLTRLLTDTKQRS
jgi:glutamyl-tRNA reductase